MPCHPFFPFAAGATSPPPSTAAAESTLVSRYS
uniref:Uncharacterized protein n=1 Tax=Arundo donax TaxID=35708 RepID=A0A0A9CBF1_ARUDO